LPEQTYRATPSATYSTGHSGDSVTPIASGQTGLRVRESDRDKVLDVDPDDVTETELVSEALTDDEDVEVADNEVVPDWDALEESVAVDVPEAEFV
jgi:hypothetical protein